MRTTITVLALSMLVLTGCASSAAAKTQTATGTQPVSASSSTGSLFAITEVGLGPDGYVALTNVTDQQASLGGLFLCQGARCFALPGIQVAPGASTRVTTASLAKPNGVAADQAALPELRPSDGELALYSSQNVNDPKALLGYLEWGFTPHDDTPVAIQAGLWIKGSYAPSAKDATRLFRQDTGLWMFDTK